MGLISRVSSRSYSFRSTSPSKMVCVPCIFIPLFLWIYNKFLHPIVDPIMRKWMGKPARKIKEDDAKSCPVSGKSEGACAVSKPEEKAAIIAEAETEPEETNIDESDDDEPQVVRRS